jgi:hypothetical protein
VKNVPEEVRYPKADTFEELYAWSKKFHNWLIENKATIKFDYEGEKDWRFWR